MGGCSNDEIREAYAKCRAVLFPGEEDFGIVPLEAMASGKAVIAYGEGGVLETVVPQNGSGPNQGYPTGVFFFEQTVKAMVDAVLYFEEHKDQFNPVEIRASMKKFSKQRFKEEMYQYIHRTYQAFLGQDHAKASH